MEKGSHIIGGSTVTSVHRINEFSFDFARVENVADIILNIEKNLFYFCNKQFHDWLPTEGIWSLPYCSEIFYHQMSYAHLTDPNRTQCHEVRSSYALRIYIQKVIFVRSFVRNSARL